MNTEKQLTETVTRLIELKQEGEYWDFKRQWYNKDKRDDMLHDIICMSNNLANRDAYIIIGVDEKHDYSLIDVSHDEERRSTQNIVDFLRDKQFAGDLRPMVTVESVTIGDCIIDVIVIYNSKSTPFYLKEKYRKVKANHIYTRVQDTNTPIDSSADIKNEEKLWKKRFGLLLTPLERCGIYLKDKKNWEQREFYKDTMYYSIFPEFTIETDYDIEEHRNGYEYYMLNQINMNAHWASVYLKYHQTVLFQGLAVCLDGGRYFALIPDIKPIKFSTHYIFYGYMIKDGLKYTFNDFLYDKDREEERWAHDVFMEGILIFENEEERLQFERFVQCNWGEVYEKKVDEVPKPHLPEDGLNYEQMEETYKIVQVMQGMLREFRKTDGIYN